MIRPRRTERTKKPERKGTLGDLLSRLRDAIWKARVFVRLLLNDPRFNYVRFFRTVDARVHRRDRRRLSLQVYGERALTETLQACERTGVTPFLLFGTLLGCYRDGGFITHDCDIDLGLCEKDIPELEQLKREMEKRGYYVNVESGCAIQFKKPRFRKLGVDFFFIGEEDGKAACSVACDRSLGVCHYPPDMFSEFETVRFLRRLKVLAPKRTEEYLALTYGDWRTPDPDFDWRRDYQNVNVESGGPGG